MVGGLGDVLRHALTFMTGSVAYKAVALLAIPILARLLTPAELGLLDLAAVVATIISLLAGVGLDTAIARFQPSVSAGRLWTTAAAILAGAAAVSVLIGLGASGTLAIVLVGSASSTSLVAAAVVYGVALAAVGFALTFVRLTDRPGVFARYAFLIVVLQMAAAIAIATLVSQPIPAVVWGWTGASIIGVGYLFWRERMPIGGVDQPLARGLIRFGAPLVPAAIVWIGADLGIRAVVANVARLDALGSYGIAARLVSILGLFVAAFGLAWHPYVFKLPRERVSAESRRALVQILGGMGVVAIAITMVAPEAVLFVAGPEYAQAGSAVPAMAAAMVALGVMTLVAGVVALERGTASVAVASGLGAAIQIGAAIVLVPVFGLAGAGLAIGVGYSVAMLVLLERTRFLMLGIRVGALVLIAAAILVGSLFLLHSFEHASLALRAAAGISASAVLVGACYVALQALPGRDPVPG